MNDVAVLACLLIPLVATPFIGLLKDRPNPREGVTLIAANLLFLVVLTFLPVVLDGGRPGLTIVEPIPGISIAFEVEPLGLLFALVASSLWIVTSIYSIGYMRGHHEENQTRFYIFFAIAISGVMGVAFSANLFTLFVFYEMLTLSTFPLVTHHGTPEAMKAGRVYLGILLTTSIFLFLPAIIWTWDAAGTLDFRPGGILEGALNPTELTILLGLFVFGIGKAAVMPFHRWLPAAMVAPTPVSALLHAVAVVKAGVFAVLKVSVYIFGIDLLRGAGSSQPFAYAAGATILIASLVAFTKDNLKARLAYSTISQLSYVVLGAMLATEAGVVGAASHIVKHAFGKITLFF
jgi:multicomponent Na+:H+ antiporter subunit D